jgi:hypothetical protein
VSLPLFFAASAQSDIHKLCWHEVPFPLDRTSSPTSYIPPGTNIMPRLSWQHIRFVEDQAPQDEGYRAYLKDMVMDFAERDPRNHNLIECAAAIVRYGLFPPFSVPAPYPPAFLIILSLLVSLKSHDYRCLGLLAPPGPCRNAGHRSADRVNHSTVSFYCQGEDGKAKFYVTEHVPVLTHRDWEIRSDSRESNRGARRRARPR